MLNKVVMVGRLAQEPELKKTPNGKSVVSTSLAVQRDYKENLPTEPPVNESDFPF